MPAWKKVIVSGSDASFKTVFASNSVTASIVSASQFTGSLFGTASVSRNTISASFATTASYVRNLYITASSTAPVSPTDNELWYDADNGKTYIRFNDGTSTQWVLQSDPTIDVNTSLQTLQEVTDLGNTTTNTVSITNTTNATDSASGAFVVDGGAGFGLDVWARKFYGDGSALTGVVAASIVEVDTLQTVTTRGTNTSASIFITNTTNATNAGVGALRVSGGLYVGLDIWAKGITSSLEGTSSWSRNSTTASFVTGSIFSAGNLALSASFATSASLSISSSFASTASLVDFINVSNKPSLFSGSSQVKLEEISGSVFADKLYTFPGDVVVQGNVTAEQLIVSTSVYFVTTSFSSGSTTFGNDVTDNHRFTGSLLISGAAFITGSTQITGSVRVLGGFTATSLTGSITASSLQGDVILGTQTSGSYIATITQGTGVTVTNGGGEGAATIIAIGQAVGTTSNVQFNQITASIVSSSQFTGSLFGTASYLTGSIHTAGNLALSASFAVSASFAANGGVTSLVGTTNEILVNGVTTAQTGQVTISLPSLVDLGASSGLFATSLTASFVSASGGLTGSLTASSLQGAITNAQLQNSSVTIGSTVISLGSTQTTIAGLVSVTSTNITGSIISASNFISGGQIFAASGFTGSISASNLQGLITNTQLRNSTISGISLGGTLAALTAGTGITSAGTYDGSTTRTFSIGQDVSTTANVTFNQITASIISASSFISGGNIVATRGFTGSLTASSLIGDIILGTQTSGSFVSTLTQGTGVTITGLTAEGSNPTISIGQAVGTTSNVQFNQITASIVSSSQFTGSLFGSSSFALTASFALNAGGGVGFPFSGSSQITGSLGVTGSISATGALTASLRQGYIWVGGSDNVTTLVPTSSLGAGGSSGANAKLVQSIASTTWSFGHFLGDQYPNITVFDSNGAVIIPGRIETVDTNNLNVYFDVAVAGTVVASVGGVATTVTAQTASYFSGTELVVSTATFTPAVTSSLTATTTVVSRVWTGSFSGAFWDYVVNNGTNYRAGTVMGVWNKIGSAQFTDTSTPDIGNTTQLTFGVVINGEFAELRATTTTSGWNVKTFVRKI